MSYYSSSIIPSSSTMTTETATTSISTEAKSRINKELSQFCTLSPTLPLSPGILSCYTPNDTLTHLHARISGPSNTPFENGHFLLVIDIPSRYPHDPPRIRFLTKMHHPNIDSQGRVAIESLNLTAAASNSCCNFRDQQQQHDTCSKIHESSMLLSPSHLATWNPNITILNLLIQIRELLKQPNFKNDGLCAYRFNYTEWWKEARKLTVKEATLAKLEYIEEAFLKTLRRDLFGIDCNNSDAGYCGKNQRKWKVKLQPKRNRLHRENHNDDDNDDDNCVMIRGKRKLYQHHDFITDDDDDNTHVQLRKKSTSLLSSSSYYLNN